VTPREITTEIELPANCCAGHFPDRPLVPGVLQLMLVERAVTEAIGESVAVAGISRVRWRKPVTPADRLRLSAALDDLKVRFELSADGVVVCDGSLVLDRLPTVDVEHPSESTGASGGPDPSTLLPHRPPMLFVDRVVEWGEHGGLCRGRIDPDSCLAAGGGTVAATAAIEFAAQAMAAVEMCRSGHDGPPRRGVLVAVSRTVASASGFPVGAALTAEVGPTTWSPPMARSSARVATGGHEILTCHLTTWESEV
jgi:predicted hotdog family 3-hydroxylacyl-ACP dehydratase